MPHHDDWLLAAVNGALAAGKAILNVYASADLSVEHKADDSPLTLADRRAHGIIMDALADSGIPVLSEEGRHIPYDERRRWRRMWIVDPLDGTKEFIKRNGEFTVNIALAEAGIPTMGVIFVPVADDLYFADATRGAFKVEAVRRLHAGDRGPDRIDHLTAVIDQAIRLPIPREPNRPFTIMGSRSHATPELTAYVERVRARQGEVDFISAGSSLKICRVAEGRADLYPRMGPTMEWDTAAGQAIATASGARVVRHDNGRPLTYNKADLRNPWFIVERKNA